jgi:MFS family permease
MSGYRRVLADRRLVLLFVASVATLTAMTALFADMPMVMSERGLGADAFGWAMMANAVGVVLMTPLITPWLSKRIATRPSVDILAAASVWVTLCMAAASFAHTTAGFCLAGFALALGETAWFVVAVGIVHRIAPAERRGLYHGIWGTALPVSWVISPLLASFSLAHGGHQMVAATTLAVGVLGAVICLPLARRLSEPVNHE